MSRTVQILLMVLAVVVGLVVGSMFNMGVIGQLPFPEGLNPNNMTEISNFMKTAPISVFAMVWLAHWGQAFIGAIIAALIAPKLKLRCALIVGAITLLGGIANAFMIPSPIWNVIIDLAGYLPIAWLGAKLVGDRGVKVPESL